MKCFSFTANDFTGPVRLGEFKDKYDNGHFQERERMSTRFHPMNNDKECVGCNRHDYSGYGKDKSFEYGLAIERKYGPGAALFLYKLSKQYNHSRRTN